MTASVYHGLDSNSNPVNDPCHDDFYLGEMGMGAFVGDSQVYNSYYCLEFNNNGNTGNTETYAQWMISHGRNDTYGYWFLLGPMLANPDASTSSYTCSKGKTVSGHRSYTVDTLADAYNWGAKQANEAYNAWLNNYPDIYRNTIFCDIEQANASGWYNANMSSNGLINGYNWYDLNRQVIIGFIQQMSSNGMVGGVYSNSTFAQVTDNWTGLGNYTSHVWSAYWNGTSSSDCLPTWDAPSIGGVSAQIWQYYGSSTFDADAAISLPS